ncbi:MAG: hypothetical protein ACOCQR_03775 [bacterium]
MEFIRTVLYYIVVVHINAFITVQYFFVTQAWFLLGFLGWAYVGYWYMKNIDKKNLKPKRRRY